MQTKGFYDERTDTLTYVVWDPSSKDAVVIDPVLDYDPVGSKTWCESVDEVTSFIRGRGLRLHYMLETHAHADHLSGSQMLRERFPGAEVAIGRRITEVQKLFKSVFDLPAGFCTDGSQFDRLLDDGEVLAAGTLQVETVFTPGHTPACAIYKVEDAIFTGDTLFMPDMGTGRCDFPAGSAEDLYDSITTRIYSLPDETRVFVGHDYQPDGRELAFETTVGESKRANIQLTDKTSKESFVDFRNERDASLAPPKLLFQSVQVNVDAGSLPAPGSNDVRYLRIPINIFRPANAESEGDIVSETA